MNFSLLNLLFEDARLLTTRKQKAYYMGCLGMENLGDDAMLVAFKKLFNDSYFLYTKNYWGRLIRALNQTDLHFDASILGGGTLINASTGILDILSKFKATKKIVFGTGVVDPSFWDSVADHQSDIPRWVDYLNTCNYISVRGSMSHDILKHWGVTGEIKIVGDPVLALSDEKISPKKNNKILGVNIGTANGKVWGGNEKLIAESMLKLLKQLKDKKWTFKFFPVWPVDVPHIEDLAKKLNLDPDKVLVKNYLNDTSFKKELREVDVFIGEKLHSVIFAFATYTPSIMIEYQPKCRDFMQSINMEKNTYRCDALNVEELENKINELYENIPLFQQHIFSEVQNVVSVLKQEASYVINLK